MPLMPNCTGWHQVRRFSGCIFPTSPLLRCYCGEHLVDRTDRLLLHTLRQLLHVLVRRGIRSQVPQVGWMSFTDPKF